MVLFLVALARPAFADSLALSAFLDRNQVAVGQAATLTIEAKGTKDIPAPSFTSPDGVNVRYAGPSTQVSFVNGVVSSTISHRYAVVPLREGTFLLGPFSVTYDGKEYRTEAIRLQAVTGAQAAKELPGRDEISLALSLGREKAYVQEPLPLTVTLTVGNVRVDDLQYPTLNADNFTIERLGEPKQTREVRDGRQVTVLRFETKLVPLRPGNVEIGPAHASMSMLVPGGRKNRDPFFDGFFGDFRKEAIDVASNALALEVLSLPEAGKPADFRGAIGQFTLEATAAPADLRVGDPITVHVAVGGSGNFNAVGAPVIDAGADFKAYPPQEVNSGGAGKAFEQVLIPLRPEVKQVPAVRFSYFDTESGRYETLTQGPFALTVRPAEQSQEARIVEAEPSTRQAPKTAEKLGRDLVYIKDAPEALWPRGQRFYSRTWFWLGLIVPALAFGGTWLRVRQRDRLRNDPRFARFAGAGRQATSALAQARSLLREGQESGFDDALSRALRDYLSHKLDLPPGAVEGENVARRLGKDGTALAEKVERVLGLLERVRYAPSAAAQPEREEALRLAEEIVAALEKRRYASAAAVAALVVTALVLSAAMPARANEDNSTSLRFTDFFDGNSLYGKGQFEEAAKAYERVLDAGFESAALYYNLGNAYMRSGKPGLAILNYERARRLAPGDVDVQTNLGFALEQQKIERDEPLWRRLTLPLVERVGSGTLAAVCVALYAALLLALMARLVWPQVRTPVGRAVLVLGALLLFAGANLGYRVARYDLAEDVVVTAAGESPVRFEPSADGTTHFSVPEGTLLHVVESRDGWLQVSRSDGRRGWIEAAACSSL